MSPIHDLRRTVLAALVADPRVSTGHIDVTARDGVVTLAGYVGNCGQRDAAGHAVRKVEGVKALINSVLIATPSRPQFTLALR